ncbi:tetratricopeptide repeat protein [Herbaspirillum sp. RTI4]|uniref:L,D-transpeptidase Cds6 family protein n=1 Tax=Herbaspirillum sp. RTI4 TaxID=3048640 RepID=UPI002AB3EF26|nr:tetratricopeptide repeat protein [Herbaspirillum sp. RTI4]MDY7578629.1 tetratricopeptide repeat protein [Herbaspirillum sp. RTI4]MEA9981065.1 tetratricopeptide repeat protein [Herbaspirillum sp. RTI4]
MKIPLSSYNNKLRFRLHGIWSKPSIQLGMLGFLAILHLGPSAAGEVEDVNKLMRSGKLSEALGKTDALLARHPRDAQLRFYRGLILAEQNKSVEAIAVFAKLTDDFPDLPEPYNNLAVLYAAAGQYDKARVALDMAIRTNPIYATAYENLGDVYAKLASQAYDKALQADTGGTAAPPKLNLVRALSGNFTGGTNPKLASNAEPFSYKETPLPAKVERKQDKPDLTPPPTAKADVKPDVKPNVKPAAPTASKPETKPETKLKPELPPLASAKPKPAEKPVDKPVDKAAEKAAAKASEKAAATAKGNDKAAEKAAAKAADKAAEKTAGVDTQDRTAIMSAINGWAKSWGDKDVKGYLSYYSADFEPPKGETRKQWAEGRRARIENKGSIDVHVEAFKITAKAGNAVVSFRQIYTSNRLTADTRKTLVMVKQGNRWYIKQERTGG